MVPACRFPCLGSDAPAGASDAPSGVRVKQVSGIARRGGRLAGDLRLRRWERVDRGSGIRAMRPLTAEQFLVGVPGNLGFETLFEREPRAQIRESDSIPSLHGFLPEREDQPQPLERCGAGITARADNGTLRRGGGTSRRSEWLWIPVRGLC